LHVDIQEVNLTITSYLIIQGISPLLWGSLSDNLGRRPIYIYSFLVYIVSNIALSFSPNFTVLLLFRGLQAAGSASTVSIGNGVIQDITLASERGGYMSFYQAIRNFSIAAGPVIGGVLANFLGFRSIFIFLLVLSSITVLAIAIFLPETLRSIAGDGSLRLTGIHQPLIRRFGKKPENLGGQDKSYVRSPIVLRTFVEPLLLLKQKEILLNLVFGGVVYAIWSMVTSSTTTLFKQLFFLDELKLGLAFVPNGNLKLHLPAIETRVISQVAGRGFHAQSFPTLLILFTGLGTIAGSTIIGILMNRSYKEIEAEYLTQHNVSTDQGSSKGSLPADFPIAKARLKHIPWITALFIISTIAYGISLGSKSLTQLPGWIAVPLILQFLIAATSNAVFAVSQTLVLDLCPGKGASSSAINNLLRCLMGAVGVAFIDKMITDVGVVLAFTGLGLITITLCPLLIIQWYSAID
jgi:multidrug resistance protein